jgi:hypothetical protein
MLEVTNFADALPRSLRVLAASRIQAQGKWAGADPGRRVGKVDLYQHWYGPHSGDGAQDQTEQAAGKMVTWLVRDLHRFIFRHGSARGTETTRGRPGKHAVPQVGVHVHAKLQSEVKLEGALAPGQIEEGVWSSMHLVHSHTRCSCQVYVDNYLDGGYHVSVLHKTLNAQVRRSLDEELVFVAAPLTQVTAVIAAGRKPVLYPGARQMVPSELPRDKQPGQCRHLADE